MYPFQHLAFGNFEFFCTSPAFTVCNGLFPNLFRAQERLVRRFQRRRQFPALQLIPNIQQNPHRVFTSFFRIWTITEGLNPLIFQDNPCHVIAIIAIHIVGKQTAFRVRFRQSKRAVLLKIPAPIVNDGGICNPGFNKRFCQFEHVLIFSKSFCISVVRPC